MGASSTCWVVPQERQSPLLSRRGRQGRGRVAGTAAGLRLPRADSVPGGHPEIPQLSFLPGCGLCTPNGWRCTITSRSIAGGEIEAQRGLATG